MAQGSKNFVQAAPSVGFRAAFPTAELNLLAMWEREF
jgi:hypothetical protein